MWRSRLLALSAVALFLAPTAAAAPSAPPCATGFGVGLVDIPAGTTDPRAATYVVDHVAPGTTFSRRIQVCNGTSDAVEVQLYAGAAELGDGAFRIVEGRAVNEVTGWIAMNPARATLQPGERLLVRTTFSVPRNAESGERYAVLLAELPAQPTSSGVPVASRVGVRVYLDVGPGGAPRSDFAVDSLQAARDEQGQGMVAARVRNTGKRALDISGSLTLQDGPGGLSGGPYPASLGTTLAPGETAPVVVPIDTVVADGPWTARLTLKSGLVERRVEAELTFPEAAGSEGPPVDVELLGNAGNQAIDPLRLLPVALIPLLIIGVLAKGRRAKGESRSNAQP